MLPGIGSFRYSFRWLPLFYIVFGLVVAQAIPVLINPPTGVRITWVNSLSLPSMLAILITMLVAIFLHPKFEQDIHLPYKDLLLDTGYIFIGICSVWMFLEVILIRLRCVHVWLPLVMTVIFMAITYVKLPTQFVVSWNWTKQITCCGPLEPNRRYMSVYTDRDFFRLREEDFGGLLRLGSTAMYADLKFINGYAALRHAGLDGLFGFSQYGWMPTREALHVVQKETEYGGMLSLMGVNRLVIGKSVEFTIPSLLAKGWLITSYTDEGIVIHRAGKAEEWPRAWAVKEAEHRKTLDEVIQLIRNRTSRGVPMIVVDTSAQPAAPYTYGSPQVRVLSESYNGLIAEVRNSSWDTSALIVFSRPWYHGFHAQLDAKSLPVKLINGLFPAVEVPAGASGILALRYFPLSLFWGCITVVLCTLILAVYLYQPIL